MHICGNNNINGKCFTKIPKINMHVWEDCMYNFILYTVFLAILNCFNVKLVSRVMTVLSFAKLVACAFIVILGLWQLIVGGDVFTVLEILNLIVFY